MIEVCTEITNLGLSSLEPMTRQCVSGSFGHEDTSKIRTVVRPPSTKMSDAAMQLGRHLITIRASKTGDRCCTEDERSHLVRQR